MAAAPQSTLKRTTRRLAPAAAGAAIAATSAIAAAVAGPSPPSRPSRRDPPLVPHRRGSSCGRGMATGRRSLSASSAATAEPSGAPSLFLPPPSLPPLCLPCPLSPRRRRRRRSPRSMRRGPRCCHLSLSLFDFNPSKLKAKIRHKRVSYRVRTLGSDGLVGLAEYLYDIIFSHFASTGYSQSSNRRNNAGSSRADSDVGRCPTSDCG